MLNNQKSWLLVILLAVFSSLVLLIISQAQTQKEVCNPEQKNDQKENIKDEFPSVNYEYSTKAIADSDRKSKSKKYNKASVLNPNITEDGTVAAAFDWETDLTALPVSKSQVIVIGKVVDAKAYLSENRASVYSEFKIEIEKVLKNDVRENFKDSKYIIAERQGGVVRFPSGFETWYFVVGQRMPKVGSKYVIFLTHDYPFLGRQEQDFHILTAYELRNGKVFPLDNPSGGRHPLVTTYRGKDETFLIEDLQDAINNLTNKSPK